MGDANDNSEEYSDDCSELFVKANGEPMHFSIRICYEKPELERMISECGGQMALDKSGPYTIRLFPRDERGFGKLGDFYSSQYIYDCVKQRKLLPINSYRLNKRSRYDGSIDPMDILMGKHSWAECKRTEEVSDGEVSEFSDDFGGSNVELQNVKKSKNRRAPYTHNERKAILNYIINNKRYAEVKGRLLWEDMSKAKVIPGRTWQSLKQQYRTFIINNLSIFKLPDNVAKRIYSPYISKTQLQPGLYSEEELTSESERETNKGIMEKNVGGEKAKTRETGLGSSKEQNAKTAGDKGQGVNEENVLNIVENEQEESGGESPKTRENVRGSSMEQYAKTADDKVQGEKDENERKTVSENKQEDSGCQFPKGSHKNDEALGRQTGKGEKQVVDENENTRIVGKDRRKEDNEVASNNHVRDELPVMDTHNRQEKHWTEQELEDLNSHQCNKEKENHEEDPKKLESKQKLEKRRENDTEDCQTSQNDIVGKFQTSKEQTEESHPSDPQTRETHVCETQEFDFVLSTEEFRCTGLAKEKPNNILMELEEDWNSGSSNDTVLSKDRFSRGENFDKNHHTENEFMKGIKDNTSSNQITIISKSPDVIQGDVCTPREFIMSKPQESVAEVNQVTGRIDEDFYQKNSQKETENQTILKSTSKVTVEDIDEMQKLIDGTFDIGNVDNVDPNISVILPNTGSGIVENLKSQGSEALLDCSAVKKKDSTSVDVFSSNQSSSAVLHHSIPDPNLIRSFLTNNEYDSLSEGSTIIYSGDEHVCSQINSEEGKNNDSGNALLVGKGEVCNEKGSSDSSFSPKRKTLRSAHRMEKKTRVQPPRNSKAGSEKVASEKADSIQPRKKTGKNSMQPGNFTVVQSSTLRDGKVRKVFGLASSGDESSPESEIIIQRSISTVNRRHLTQQLVPAGSPESPLDVSQDIELSSQEKVNSRSDDDSTESEENSVDDRQNLFRETPSPGSTNQLSVSDPDSSRDSFTGRFDRSFYPHGGCRLGASRRTSGHINRKESYSMQEDMVILSYIARHQAYHRVGGRELWQEMQRCEILQKRSWHSMKERFRKRIIFRLHTYLQLGLSKEIMKHFQKYTPVQVEEPAPERGENIRRPYTHVEDALIVKFIAQNRRYSEVGGKTLWVLMSSAVPGLKNRTWLSLKERFRKNIVNHLEDFDLSKDEVENFGKRWIKPVRRNGRSKNRILFRKPPIMIRKHHSKPVERLGYESECEDDTDDDDDDDEVEMSNESDSDNERLRKRISHRISFKKSKRRLKVTDGKNERLHEVKCEERKGTKQARRCCRLLRNSSDSQIKPSTSGNIPLKKGSFDDETEKDDRIERSQEDHPTEFPITNLKRKLFNQDEMAKLSPRTPFNKGTSGSMNRHWKDAQRKEMLSSSNEEEQRKKKSKKETSSKSNEEENAHTSEEGSDRYERIEEIPVLGYEVAMEEQNSRTESGESKEDRSPTINRETLEADSEGNEEQDESVIKNIDKSVENVVDSCEGKKGNEEQDESVIKNVDKSVESVVDSCEGKKIVKECSPSTRGKILTSENKDDESKTQAVDTPGPDVQERSLSHLTNVEAKSLKTVVVDGSKSSSDGLIDVVNVSETDQKHDTESDLENEMGKEVNKNFERRHKSAQNEATQEQRITRRSSELPRFIRRNKFRKKIIRQRK